MLEEQNGRFATKSSIPAKGYLKVETGNNKGALRCVVQNLKYYEKGDYRYKLILFGKRGERTIHTVIGDVPVNRQGNGESYFRFLPEDVDGRGNAFHYFTTAIVAAASTKDEKEPLHPVLKGATISEEEPFRPEAAAAASDLTETGEPETEYETGYGPESESEREFRPEPESRSEPEIEKQIELQPEEEPQEPLKKEEELREPPPPKRVYNGFYNEYILNACAHTCRSAEFFEDTSPFEKDKTGARWKKIVNTAALPLISPGAHYFAARYRHYIFGAKPDGDGIATKFFFGIPGRFLDEEQPDGGRSGFTYWQPIRVSAPVFEEGYKREPGARGEYGYWIVAVDGKTGNIEEV